MISLNEARKVVKDQNQYCFQPHQNLFSIPGLLKFLIVFLEVVVVSVVLVVAVVVLLVLAPLVGRFNGFFGTWDEDISKTKPLMAYFLSSQRKIVPGTCISLMEPLLRSSASTSSVAE